MKTKEILDIIYDGAVDGVFEDSEEVMKQINKMYSSRVISVIVQEIWRLGYEAAEEDQL